MSAGGRTLVALLRRFAGGMRFPQLFWFTALLFALDLVIPDLLPFADEILLGLATMLLASWRVRRAAPGAAKHCR